MGGLMLSEDGTVQSNAGAEVNALDATNNTGVPQELLLPNSTETELAEATNAEENTVPKQESVSLPSAPDPNIRPKDIIEESLAQSQFGTDSQVIEESETNATPTVTTATTTQQLNITQPQETVVQQPVLVPKVSVPVTAP